MSAETTASKQRTRGRPFEPGQSGNRKGRPRGARNAATLIAEQLLDGEAETLTRKVIDKAKRGNLVALKMCLDRLIPPRRKRPVCFKLPKLRSASDAAEAMARLTEGVGNGDISASEAAELAKLVESFVRALEASEIEERLRALEQRQDRQLGQ
jgi:hypothetical protein